MQIKYQTILQFDTINLGGHGQAMPAQIAQSNKFAKTLQKLQERKEEWTWFLLHWASQFSLNDTTIFDECGQICQKYSK